MQHVVKADKKELIRQAALSAFAKYGFHNTTANQIAVEAEVAVGTIYNHFADKEDILIHIFETEMAERQAAIQVIVVKALPMRNRIREILDFHLDRARKNKTIMRLFLGEELHLGGKLESATHKLFKEVPEQIAKMLQAAMDCDQLRQMDPLVLAHAVMGACRTVMARACLYKDEEALRLQENAVEELTDFIWNGIRPNP